MPDLKPHTTGYAEAAEGLGIYYEVYGQGEPIVVLPGGMMGIGTMAQVIGPLSRTRQVIGVELEGHARTGLRDTPMTHERLGEDVAAVLRALKLPRADVAGYSHGGAAALRLAIQHPQAVRNLILISTTFAWNGWYPEAREGMSGVSGSMAEPLKGTPLYDNYAHPEQFARFLDHMGALLSQDYDWREATRALPMPVLLLFADNDSISLQHIAEFFALFDGGVREPGFQDPKFSQARLAIVPGYTHYNFGQSPELAPLIERFLTQPTSKATQFTPE